MVSHSLIFGFAKINYKREKSKNDKSPKDENKPNEKNCHIAIQNSLPQALGDREHSFSQRSKVRLSKVGIGLKFNVLGLQAWGSMGLDSYKTKNSSGNIAFRTFLISTFLL